jgi:hypothetical protein
VRALRRSRHHASHVLGGVPAKWPARRAGRRLGPRPRTVDLGQRPAGSGPPR